MVRCGELELEHVDPRAAD